MTWIAPEAEEPDVRKAAPEREALQLWLDLHRQTLLRKCAGLTGEQLATRSVEPSTLSLLGLVRHMSEVERWWFRRLFGGDESLGDLFDYSTDEDADFNEADGATAAADFEVFAAEVAAADAAVRGRDLDETFQSRKGFTLDLRWVYLHMIEEYARHNGHADLLRERIDGATG